jgi:hypothetical protein
MKLKESWGSGGKKYQIVGDNWDKNIVPSYRYQFNQVCL